MERPQKIFLGFSDIASAISDFRRGFSLLGIETLTAVRKTSTIQDCRVDFKLEEMLPPPKWFQDPGAAEKLRRLSQNHLTQYLWDMAMAECDTFIFVWDSFLPDFRDLSVLKDKGKRVGMIHMGSDIRYLPALVQEFQARGLPDPKPAGWNRDRPLAECLQSLRTAEKFADVRWSGPPTSQLALRPYYRLPFAFDVQHFPFNPKQRKIPRIAHAPSSRAIKGTDVVLAVLEGLRAEGLQFEVDLIEGVSHEQALHRYADADIVISQLYLPGGGRLAFETLCTGSISFSAMGDKNYPLGIADPCPIVNVSEESLEDVLREWIPDHSRRETHALLGREYIEAHYTSHKACRSLLEAFRLGDAGANLIPRFFREEFLPSNPSEVEILNQGTASVRETSWYQESVPTGERAGLYF